MLGCVAREEGGLRGWIKGFLIGHVYAIYTWFLWPVLVRSTAAPAHRPPRLGEDRARARELHATAGAALSPV